MQRHVLLIVFVVSVIAAGCGGSPEPAAPPALQGAPTAEPEPTIRPLEDVVTAELELEGADWLAATGGRVWTRLERAQDVVAIDPSTDEPGKPIDVGPGFCEGLGAGLGAVWACSDGALARIDPRAERIEATVDLNMKVEEGLIGVGEGAIWVLDDSSGETLLGVDPRTNEVAAEIPLGHPGTEVGVGFDSVWVTSADDGMLLRVDPSAQRVVAEFEDLPQARFVTAGEGSVWVSYEDGLARIDPVAGEVVANVDEPIGFSGGLAIGDGSLWIRSSVSFLSRLDLVTNEVVETFDPGEEIGGGSVLHAYGSVWVTALDDDRLWRLDV